jgi:hypothetical protein
MLGRVANLLARTPFLSQLIAKIFLIVPAILAIRQVFGARRHQPVNFATKTW